MELVSANTRNFLFLTISQYNDQQKDVRARVSMRRDQPFWEGGNSFIACESFRISASPSPGGLFYKEITPDFFLGARVDESNGDATWNPVDNEGADRLQNAAIDVGRSPDVLQLKNPKITTSTYALKDSHVIEGDLRLALNVEFKENRTRDLIERFSRYFNPKQLTRGSYVRCKGFDTEEPPAACWVSGTVDRAPSQLVTGNGVGSANLFTPKFEFKASGPFLAQLIGMEAGFGQAVQFVVYNEGGLDSESFEKLLRKVLSSGTAYMECNHGKKDGSPSFVHPVVDGAVFRFRGPRGLQTKNNHLLDQNGVVAEVVHWKAPLQIGTKLLASSGKHAMVTKLDKSWITEYSPGLFQVTCVVELTAAGVAGVAGPLDDVAIRQAFSLTASSLKTQDVTGATIQVNIDNWDGKADDSKTVPSKMGNADYLFLRKDNQKQLNLVRHADSENTRTLYTPNEFFRVFNAENRETKVPWSLSTDANGGFVVNWEPQDTKNYTSLIVSKTMTEELGLNTYMTFDGLSGSGEEEKEQYATISRPDDYMSDNFSNAFSTVLSSQLWADENLGVHFDWTTAMAAENLGYGTDAWLVDGSKVKIMSVAERSGTNEDSHEIRIYGDYVEEDGLEFYQYHSLPPHARLGNRGEVSVESFSTYSQIDLVIPNLPFQPMLGSNTDNRILASLRLPFEYGTNNDATGRVTSTNFSYYGDLLYNSDSSRSYLRITTDQQLYDCDVEARLIKRTGEMTRMKIPYKGQFQVKLRFLQTQ